jgi:diacylglycerol kinase (ATP)
LERKIIYLINPISGTKKKDKVLAYIKAITTSKNIWHQVHDTNAEGNYEWLLHKINEEYITDVVVVGGDGSINQVVKAVGSSSSVNIGIIPSGSGNGLAFTAKIPKDYKKALEIIFKNNALATDAFSINQEFSCHLCGLGFDAQVAHEFAQKASRGLITYTKQTLKNYIKAPAYSFDIIIAGKTFSTEAFLISIANSNQFGNHFTIAPMASLHDGLLDIVIVQKRNKLSLPFAMIQHLRGKNKIQSLEQDLKQKAMVYLQASQITITNLQQAPLHIDGDPAKTATKFDCKVLPNYFKLLV